MKYKNTLEGIPIFTAQTRSNENSITRLFSTVYCTLICAGYLLVLSSGGYESLGDDKYHVFLIVSVTCISLSLLAHLVQSHPLSPAARGIRLERRVCWTLAAFLAFTIVSAMLSPCSDVWLGMNRREGVLAFFIYAVTFLVTALDLEPKRWMLWGFFAVLCPSFLIGTLQLLGQNPLHLFPNGLNYYDSGIYYPGQYWGTIGNADYVSAVLSLAAGAFSAAGIRAQNRNGRRILIPLFFVVFYLLKVNVQGGIVAMAVGFVILLFVLVDTAKHAANAFLTCCVIFLAAATEKCICFTESGVFLRFSFPALAFSLLSSILLFACLWIQRQQPAWSSRLIRKRMLLFLLLSLLVVVLFLYFLPTLPGETLQQLHEILHGHIEDQFGSGRIYIWRQILPLIREHFWFGGGPDTLSTRGLQGFTNYNDTLGGYVATNIDVAHNEYLNILVNQGIFAFLSYFLLLVQTCVSWWKNRSSNSVAICGAAACFYAIQAFFGISSFYIAPLFWTFLALANQRHIPQLRSS